MKSLLIGFCNRLTPYPPSVLDMDSGFYRKEKYPFSFVVIFVYMLSFCGDSQVGQNGASGHYAVPAVAKGHKFVQGHVRSQTVANAAAKVLSTTLETALHHRDVQVICLST